MKVSNNFEFSYIERGNADECETSLLLVHGFTSDKESWCLTGKAIPKRVHIVAPDLPGHGSTTRKEKDDVSIEGLAKRIEQVRKEEFVTPKCLLCCCIYQGVELVWSLFMMMSLICY